MSDVISDVENPKPDDKHGDGGRPEALGVTKQPPDVGGVSDNEDGDDDRGGAGENERPAAAEAASAFITEVADERLDEEAGNGAAEPDDARPLVRDPELLNVRG